MYWAKKTHCLTLAITLSLQALVTNVALADKIQLIDGKTLSGDLQKLTQETVVLKSAMAEKPLQISASSIKSITFPNRGNPDGLMAHGEKVTLANNDTLPCKIISMDQTHVLVTTTYAGEFNILRSDILALKFGVRNEKVVFVGDQDPGQWSNVEGTWEKPDRDENSYVGTGSLAQKIDLPENLRIKFTLGWNGEKPPNFVLRFCSEQNSAITKQNTYELSFNSAGMQIRRYLSSTQPSVVIANIPTIRPQSYPENKAEIDLQVDRQEREISLNINSEHVATWPDPFDAPTGEHIIFNNRSKELKSCIISDILVTSLADNALPRYHADKTAPTTTDLLIDSEGERISGKLTTITADPSGKRSVKIITKHTPTELRIPDHRISSLSFAKTDKESAYPETSFTLELGENGNLQLTKPEFIDNKVSFTHPILGKCELSSASITRIKRTDPQADEKKGH